MTNFQSPNLGLQISKIQFSEFLNRFRWVGRPKIRDFSCLHYEESHYFVVHSCKIEIIFGRFVLLKLEEAIFFVLKTCGLKCYRDNLHYKMAKIQKEKSGIN